MTYTNDFTDTANPNAEQALRRLLGGKARAKAEPVDDAANETDENETDEQARKRILAMPVGLDVGYTYASSADACAKLMIETLEIPGGEKLRRRIAAAKTDWDRVDLLYDATNQRTDGALKRLGLTGFQVGWAANMAFKLARTEQPMLPVKNPAIIEVNSPGEVKP